jgi:hypothetical protein
VKSDIAEFHAAFATGDLERAVGVYEGQFLDGFHLPGAAEFERWLESERSGLARDHATALERLARRAEDRHDEGGAVDWWRRLASLDPLDGKRTLRLMEALVRCGDRVGALKQARIYEVLLSQELELPPDHDVIALAERIRAADGAPIPTPSQTPAVTVPAHFRNGAASTPPGGTPASTPAGATRSPNVASPTAPTERQRPAWRCSSRSLSASPLPTRRRPLSRTLQSRRSRASRPRRLTFNRRAPSRWNVRPSCRSPAPRSRAAA